MCPITNYNELYGNYYRHGEQSILKNVIFLFQPEVFRTGDCYYEGYWQNYRYFDDIFSEVSAAFSFKNGLERKNKMILEQISNNQQAVSIHIRRGDYINHKTLGNICDIEYYTKLYN